MTHSDGGAPAWLFSFVDLAFLMVIAMTQLAPNPGAEMPDLGEMIVPRVAAAAATEMGNADSESWQLRVHPPEPEESSPFELVHFVDGIAQVEGARLVERDLRSQLASLKVARAERPMLAPHEDSRSQDMLEAASLLEEIWPGRRLAAVQRDFDRG